MNPPNRLARAKALRDAQARELGEQIAFDLADLLEKAGATQTEVANALGYQRSWLNKLANGRNEMSLQDYLQIIGLVKEFVPDHPAVKLAHFLRTRPRPRLRVVKKE